MGHSPAFAVREFGGSLSFEGGRVGALRLRLVVRADSFTLTGEAREADRREIEGTMWRDVLETGAHPEIGYEADGAASETVAPGRYRVRINGRLSLHGVIREHPVGGDLT